MNKKEWRQWMQNQLRGLTREERTERSAAGAAFLYSTPMWKNAKTIGITVSREFEWETRPVIERAWSEKKMVVVPKCSPKTREMTFRNINSYDQLENVYMDLYEPSESQTEAVKSKAIDLLVVPGLVFDEKGYRIGYGGGYYDRYLSDYHGETIALAFDFQVVKELPAEIFDVPVKHCYSETGKVK